MDLARAPRRTARKKGSGYENELERANLVPRARLSPRPHTEARPVNLKILKQGDFAF